MAYRASLRLPGFEYRGPFAYSLTLVTGHRCSVFRDAHWVDRGVHHLCISARQYGFTTLAHCVEFVTPGEALRAIEE